MNNQAQSYRKCRVLTIILRYPFLFRNENLCSDPFYNRLGETVLIRDHNICFMKKKNTENYTLITLVTPSNLWNILSQSCILGKENFKKTEVHLSCSSPESSSVVKAKLPIFECIWNDIPVLVVSMFDEASVKN